MKIVSNGEWIQIPPRGPAGPDGNPIGTIISYMGLAAPDAYLICDGTVYPIGEYPDLAKFFQKQFGTVNYFGGDGTSTFAVPDMRNLFLRGYHGEAEETLSAEIGVKQDATNHLNVRYKYSFINIPRSENDSNIIESVKNQDEFIGLQKTRDIVFNENPNQSIPQYYTSRPVNMAVLYCIKAVESFPNEIIFSTQERRIGTWIDGKPVYQKTAISENGVGGAIIANDVETVISADGVANNGRTILGALHYNTNSELIGLAINDGTISFNLRNWETYTIIITVKYTKTTDQATIELPAALTAALTQALFAAAPQSAAAVTLDAGIKNEEV